MRRVLKAGGRVVSDEAAFSAAAPYYDGEKSVQSFEQLQHELLSAAWAVPIDAAAAGDEGVEEAE